MNLKKYYAKWKNPETKDYILYNSLYMKHPEEAPLQRYKADQRLPGAQIGSRN